MSEEDQILEKKEENEETDQDAALKAEEEAKKKAAAEAKKKAAAEAKKKTAAVAKKKTAAVAKKKTATEAKKKAATEAKKKAAEEELKQKEWDKKAREEAKKKAEQEAKIKAKEQSSDGIVSYLMSDAENFYKILKGLKFKGGSSKINSLKIAVMMDEKSIKTGLDDAILLKFVEKNKEIYSLAPDGVSLLSETGVTQQEMVADSTLKIEAYKDIIYRMKMSGGFIKESQVAQAFYILNPDMREEIRKIILNSFTSFGIYSKLIEPNDDKANPGYQLTKIGEKTLDRFISLKKSGKGKLKAVAPKGDISCGSCGKPVNPDFMMCPYCGSALKGKCSKCGKELQAGWKMCPYCSTPR
jgi:flagellar biosynthesis GTPase FlhF